MSLPPRCGHGTCEGLGWLGAHVGGVCILLWASSRAKPSPSYTCVKGSRPPLSRVPSAGKEDYSE